MTLQLDPRVPLVWRSPNSLQFGVDVPRLVLDELSAVDEQLIAALRRGSTPARLDQLARASGADSESVAALMARLAPVLLNTAPPAHGRRGRLLIDGLGNTALSVKHAVHDDGIAESVHEAPDFVVLVGHYAIAPRRYGRWLRNDVPLLPIVFSDDGVRIGPLVVPGTGPCLYCLDLTRTEGDAAWPAIASQLIDDIAPGETPRATAAVTTIVSAVLAEWFGAGNDAEQLRRVAQWVGSSVRIEPTGWISRAQHQPHPRCGCQILTERSQNERLSEPVPTQRENVKLAEAFAGAGR